jgi:hypothetical protein
MKRPIFSLLIGGLSLSLIFSGCSKKTDDSSNPTPPSSSGAPTPSFTLNNASGVLVALKTVTQQTVAGITIPVEMNSPTAVFPSSPGSGNFVDAGTVTFNTKSLSKLSNNSYIYNDALNPVDFTHTTWVVSGSTSVPAFNYTEDKQIPVFTDFSTLPASVPKTVGLTLNLSGKFTNADSVYVVLISTSNSKMVLKRMAGTGVSCSFSSNDLSVLGSGSGYLEVCPWNYKTEDFNSKIFYFIMESAYVKSVSIN